MGGFRLSDCPLASHADQSVADHVSMASREPGASQVGRTLGDRPAVGFHMCMCAR